MNSPQFYRYSDRALVTATVPEQKPYDPTSPSTANNYYFTADGKEYFIVAPLDSRGEVEAYYTNIASKAGKIYFDADEKTAIDNYRSIAARLKMDTNMEKYEIITQRGADYVSQATLQQIVDILDAERAANLTRNWNNP